MNAPEYNEQELERNRKNNRRQRFVCPLRAQHWWGGWLVVLAILSTNAVHGASALGLTARASAPNGGASAQRVSGGTFDVPVGLVNADARLIGYDGTRVVLNYSRLIKDFVYFHDSATIYAGSAFRGGRVRITGAIWEIDTHRTEPGVGWIVTFYSRIVSVTRVAPETRQEDGLNIVRLQDGLNPVTPPYDVYQLMREEITRRVNDSPNRNRLRGRTRSTATGTRG